MLQTYTQSVLQDRFQILKPLGRGGMGEVYLALDHARDDRPVAIKLVKNHREMEPLALERFRNETLTGKLVSHPNVIRGLEVIERPNLIAYVMEYADAGTLAGEIKNARPGIKRCLEILCELVDGVAEIHRAGIVHRDLKPENILLTSEGSVKISDFGVACFAGGADNAREGMLLGTPKYIAPEYIESGEFDHRSDIYALGVIAYELICGRSPFRSTTREEIILERFERSAAELHALCPACPASLVRIVEKAMAISVHERYQGAEEMLEDLKSVLERRCTRKISEEIDSGLLQRVRSNVRPVLEPQHSVTLQAAGRPFEAGFLSSCGRLIGAILGRK